MCFFNTEEIQAYLFTLGIFFNEGNPWSNRIYGGG